MANRGEDRLTFAIVSGGFIWIVFDNLVLGMVVGVLVYGFMKAKTNKEKDE